MTQPKLHSIRPRFSIRPRLGAGRISQLLLLAVPLLPAALAFACGGGNENLPPPPPPPPPMPMASAAPPAASSASAGPTTPPVPPAPPVALVEGAASPDPPAPTPVVKITAPNKDQVIPTAKASDFEAKLDVKNWKTAAGDAHVHLILDDKPYKRIDDPKAPVKLSELTGGEALADGQHILVAFASRANHESVKTPGSLAVVEFWIGKKGERAQDPTKPMLIYSRPKGDYKAEMANHVLIDFQLANATLAADKNHVHVAVTGPGIDGEKSADVTKFGMPLYLDNLQDGSYSVKLDLLGGDGKPFAGPYNSVTRSFAVAH
jgi:hypothetical protein